MLGEIGVRDSVYLVDDFRVGFTKMRCGNKGLSKSVSQQLALGDLGPRGVIG
jgi:hypothetical protein